MAARVLVVGPQSYSAGSIARRIERALVGLGYAVRLIDASSDIAVELIVAAGKGFQPTVSLVNPTASAEVIAAVRALGVPLAVFNGDASRKQVGCCEDVALTLPVVQDTSYRAATTSMPTLQHDIDALLVQHPDARRRAVVDALMLHSGVSVESLSAGWGMVSHDPTPWGEAFFARRARLVLLFGGEDAPTQQEMALLLSGGCVLLAEDALVVRLGDSKLAASLPTFSASTCYEVVAGLLHDDTRYACVLADQQAWLDGLPHLDDSLRELICTAEQQAGGASSGCEERVRNITVYGWLGMDNFGDDLLLQVVADRVKERFPNAVIRVIGGNPRHIEEQYGFEAVLAGDYYGMEEMLRVSDAVVFCGGLIFDDPMSTTAGTIEMFMEPFINPACQAGVCLMAWRFGVPALYLGAGLGPIAKPAARAALRYIGLAGARLLLRDQDSVKLALDCGYPSEQVAAYADLVLSAHDTVLNRASDNLPSGLEPGRYLTVALRDWPLNPPGFERALAAELDRIASQTGLTIAFVPFDPDDVHIHHRVADAMQTAQVVEVKTRLSMPDMLAVVKHSAMAVAMRLHCSILHHVLGKPAIGLDYNEKVGSHFREMERGDYLVSLDEVTDRLSDAALRAWNDPEATKAEIEEGLDALRPKVEAAFQELFCAIEAHEPAPEEPEVYYPRARSQAAVDLEASRAHEQELASRVEALEGELSAARARIADLEQSTSYRLGHALVKVPHALFKRS